MNRISKYFLPIQAFNAPIVKASKKSMELTCKSQKLMLDLGLIKRSSKGSFFLLPFTQRSVDKLVKVINEEFSQLGALKISMPCLTKTSLWKKTGRYEENVGELYHVRNRDDEKLIMSPTHEESVSHLLSSVPPLSHRQLPLLLYQISLKFRDELRPRFGLIRSDEFLMADLYSFDESVEAAEETYNNLRTAIKQIFKKIGVSTIEVKGDTGMMGGLLSHELHLSSDIGDDSIQYCSNCDYAANKNLIDSLHTCKQCDSNNLKECKGIEVAHTFLLGEKYSKPFGACFTNNSNQRSPYVMGSYGIGVSRIIGAVTEVLSTDDQLRWPSCLAPFSVCIIPPQVDKRDTEIPSLATNLYNAISGIEELRGDIILDDRLKLSIGKRLLHAQKLGFPFIIILGKSAFEVVPKFEIHDTYKNECLYLELPDIIKYLTENYPVEISS